MLKMQLKERSKDGGRSTHEVTKARKGMHFLLAVSICKHCFVFYWLIMFCWLWQEPKDYDIVAIPLTNAAIRMLRSNKATPEEWHQYLGKPSSAP